jgi:hypothetical protein
MKKVISCIPLNLVRARSIAEVYMSYIKNGKTVSFWPTLCPLIIFTF